MASAVKHTAWEVWSQGWNLKDMTEAKTSGGVCGLMRYSTQNLTNIWKLM